MILPEPPADVGDWVEIHIPGKLRGKRGQVVALSDRFVSVDYVDGTDEHGHARVESVELERNRVFVLRAVP